MKPKLLELAEILKQKPEIKERLERLEFGCWIEADLCNFEDEIGGTYVAQLSMKENDYGVFYSNKVDGYENLYEINFYGLDDMGYGSDETLDKIISLCKNNVPRN